MSTDRRGAITVSWAAAIPGREAKMLEVLNGALKYLIGLRTEGRIEDLKVFVPKIGSFRDTLLIFGLIDDLMTVLVEPEFETLLVEGTIFVQDLRLEVWEGGSPEWLAQNPDPYIQQLQKHGLI
jgi:hypothetical protein